MTNAIEIKDLCKKYPGFTLKDVSFSVPEGFCCGFIGANGAGKTTTLKILAGMASSDSGEIRLLNHPESDASVKKDIGILFDQPYFPEEWTALNIAKCLRPFYQHWDNEKYLEYLSRFGLDPHKKFRSFSRGMRMKLALAVHFSHDAKLLLLDEPMGGLDPAMRDELRGIMREYLVSEGRTILFSTHIISDLESIADSIVYIQRGKIAFCGSKDDLTSSYCAVRGTSLPAKKRQFAIGLREHGSGYECLMALEHIGGLPSDTITERATLEEIVIYLERYEREKAN